MIELTEQQLRNNEPIELFVIDGKPVKVKLLGSVQAEKWISGAREIADLDLSIQTLTEAAQKAQARLSAAEDGKARDKARSDTKELGDKLWAAQKDRVGRIRACMHDYDPTAFTQEVIAAASLPQLEAAFQLLFMHNDPFSCSTLSRLDLMSAMKNKITGIVGGMKS
jgi:hypothetical protein